MAAFATVDDLASLWRRLSADEQSRAERLLDVVSSELRLRAERCGKDLDALAQNPEYANVLRSVVCDVVARSLLASTDSEPMTQFSQSAGGYTVSGTVFNAGGGIFIKKNELSRLGLRNQTYGGLNVYGTN